MAAQKGATQSEKPAGRETTAIRELLVPLLVLTCLAGGGGAYIGANVLSVNSGPLEPRGTDTASDVEKSNERPDDHGAKMREGGKIAGSAVDHEKLQLRELPPIVTNLGDPPSHWVRIQTSIVYDPKAVAHIDVLAAELASDFIGYLRTVPLPSLEGAAGLRRLHEELSDRASIRSEGAVRKLIVQSLVVQ